MSTGHSGPSSRFDFPISSRLFDLVCFHVPKLFREVPSAPHHDTLSRLDQGRNVAVTAPRLQEPEVDLANAESHLIQLMAVRHFHEQGAEAKFLRDLSGEGRNQS